MQLLTEMRQIQIRPLAVNRYNESRIQLFFLELTPKLDKKCDSQLSKTKKGLLRPTQRPTFAFISLCDPKLFIQRYVGFNISTDDTFEQVETRCRS